MRNSAAWILIILLLSDATIALAQDDIELEYLYINNPYGDAYFCTAEQALAFYEALDEYPALVEEISDISTGVVLLMWTFRFASWYETAEQECYGAGNPPVELERDARYLAIQHMTGEEAILPEENAYTRALEMSIADRETLEEDETTSEYDLEVNREIVEVPLCDVERAMAFYETTDAFVEASSGIAGISDRDSLREWAAEFYTWSDESWAPLLEEPCGQMKSFIAFLESFAYGAALAQLTGTGEITLKVFDETMELLGGWMVEEIAWLQDYLDE